MSARQPQHPQTKRDFLAKAEVPHAQEQRSQVQWRREHARRRAGGSIPIRTDKGERAVTAEGVGQASQPAEIEKIRAAAHRHVLAGIDEAARHRILKRSGPSAGAASGLQHGHLDVGGGGERGGSCEAGQPATDDDDVRPSDSISRGAKRVIHAARLSDAYSRGLKRLVDSMCPGSPPHERWT